MPKNDADQYLVKLTGAILSTDLAVVKNSLAEKDLLGQLSHKQLFGLLREAVSIGNNEVFSALFRNQIFATCLQDMDTRDRLLTHAIKFANNQDSRIVRDLLSVPNIELKASGRLKDIFKTSIKAKSFMPEQVTQAMFAFLCNSNKGSDFSDLLSTDGAIKAFLKQTNSDREDFEDSNFGSLSRIRAIKDIIKGLSVKDKNLLFVNANKYVNAMKPEKMKKQTVALALIANFCGAGTITKDKKAEALLKAISSIEREEKETEEYYTTLVDTATDSKTKVSDVERLLENPEFYQLKDWQLKDLLYAVVVARQNDVLEVLLTNDRFQQAAAGPEFRNHVFCAAIESLNARAIELLLPIDNVDERLQTGGKDAVKILLQAIAAEPRLSTGKHLPTAVEISGLLCANKSFKNTFLQDKTQITLVNELCKDKDSHDRDRLFALQLLLAELSKDKDMASQKRNAEIAAALCSKFTDKIEKLSEDPKEKEALLEAEAAFKEFKKLPIVEAISQPRSGLEV